METLSQVEAIPAAYPNTLGDALWQRIESYCAHRWTPRDVVWIVDGPGQWQPPLYPAVISTTELWRNGAYEAVTLDASPMGGLFLPSHGPYRVTGTVGTANAAPAVVLEAFERLRDYIEAEPVGVPGASSYSVNIGQLSETIRRDPAHVAKAMQMSGAADLLRPYRRA